MRRVVSAALAVLLLWCFSVPTSASVTTIGLIINGQRIESDSPPFVLNHSLLVPLRATAEGLGYRVAFLDADQSITLFSAANPEPLATLWLYSDRVVRDGADLVAPFPVITRSGRSFIPVEFAASLLDFDVKWDENRSALSITTDYVTATAQEAQKLAEAVTLLCGVNPDKDGETSHLAQQQIWVDAEARALTSAELLPIVRSLALTSAFHLSQACAITVRRAEYRNPPNSDTPDQSGWLVTYNGLEMYGRGPSTVVNRELHVVLAQDLRPIMGLSYR